MSTFDPTLIAVPILIVITDIAVYFIVGRLGRRSSGKGSKYEPFTGGEESIPQRGLYNTQLFVFAVLFMVVETFALILAGSFVATSSFYPILFLMGGGGVILLVSWWFMIVGGGEL